VDSKVSSNLLEELVVTTLNKLAASFLLASVADAVSADHVGWQNGL
jgi:hypothetical protein